MSFNLPDGVSTSDLPGCRPVDEFCMAYVDDRIEDMNEFHDWLEGYLDASVKTSDKALRALWQFDEVFLAYESHLNEKAAQAWAERG